MATPTPELKESDFIHEGFARNPTPLWTWLLILLAMMGMLWIIGSGYYDWMRRQVSREPFLQVTNRELSLFLWQFPDYMRGNYKGNRFAYLPAFRYEGRNVSLDPQQADEYVSAPPELLFLYHTWSRLLKNESLFTRPISTVEFAEFLQQRQEWLPEYWPDAPKGYVDLIASLHSLPPTVNLLSQSNDVLPLDVRLAFQGWKNFFKDGEAINDAIPTFGQMQAFLAKYPHYARNYWKNIIQPQSPDYLLANFQGKGNAEAPLPKSQLAGFLMVAFFNYQEALSGR